MSLKEKLDAARAASAARRPSEVRAIMDRATADLRASGILRKIVAIGQTAPTFSAPNYDGRVISSKELLAKGPLVLSFFRGAWWPYCRHELDALQAVYGEVRALEAEIVVLSPELPSYSAEMVAKQGLTFPIINDHGLRIARSYGLAFTLPDDLKDVYLNVFKNDLEKRNGESTWQLPMPARFVIDRSGIVRYADADPDYTVRPEPADTVAVLKTLLWTQSIGVWFLHPAPMLHFKKR